MSIEAKLYKITIDKPEPPFYYVGCTAQVGKGDSYLHSSLNKQLKEDMSRYPYDHDELEVGTKEDMATQEYRILHSVDAINNDDWYNNNNGGGKYVRKHGNLDAMDSFTEKLRNKEFLLGDSILLADVEKMRRFQVRHKVINRKHKLKLQDNINTNKGDMRNWEPIIVLEDFDGEGEHLLFQGNHTTQASIDSGKVHELPHQLVPKEEWSKLTDDELETVCRRLNPQHEKPSLPTDDDEAIAWIVDKHFEKNISPSSDIIYEEMEKWGYQKSYVQRSLVYHAEKKIKSQKGIPSGHIIIDYTQGSDKNRLEKKLRKARTDNSDAYSISSGYFKLDNFLDDFLDNADQKKKDRLELIKIFVYHVDYAKKEEWDNKYYPIVKTWIDGLNKISQEEYRVQVEFEVLPFTRPNPIKQTKES